MDFTASLPWGPGPPGHDPFTHFAASEVGVLVSHGFTGSPGSMLPLARAFAAANWNVECPLLSGHGTHWEDIVGLRAEDWLGDLEAAKARLKARSRKLFVAGFSMGGTLALRLAQTDREILGVMVINQALVFSNPFTGWAGLLRHLVRSVPAIASDIKDPAQTEPAYDRTPLAGVAELNRLAKRVKRDLHLLETPLLVFKSREDHVLPIRNATLLMERAASRDKELVMLEHSYHVATLDYDSDLINRKCLEFVRRIVGGSGT